MLQSIQHTLNFYGDSLRIYFLFETYLLFTEPDIVVQDLNRTVFQKYL